MRASTIVAAALPMGAYAVPLFGFGLSIPNPICLPYNIIVNTLQTDPVLVPFCAKYTSVAYSTVTAGLNKAAAATPVTVTSAMTVNGGGAVTITNFATTTVPAPAPNAVTNYVTVSVTVPTATTVATCLNSAYAAPVSKKLSKRSLFGFSFGAPAAAPAPVAAPVAPAGPAGGPAAAAAPAGGPVAAPAAPTPVAPIAGAVAGAAAGAGAAAAGAAAGAVAGPVAPAPIAAPPASVARPAYIPVGYSDAIIQIICGCVSIPTQVTTVQPLAAQATTVTVMPTVTINAATSISITKTVTITAAAAGVAMTVTSTTTTTVNAVATSIVPNGLVYKKFPSSFDGYLANPGFTATAFKGLTPDFTGVWNNLNFATPYWPSMSVADTIQLDQAQPFDVSQAALLFEGFFIAPQTGAYTFSVPAASNDNFAELWTGAAALTWADSSAAFKAIRTATTSSDGTTTVTLNKGDAMPFTYLWANGGGAGQSAFNMVFPDGSSPTDFSTLFVQPCTGTVFSS